MQQSHDPDMPRYTISVVAQLVELHPQTLRNYEDCGLVVPQRSPGNFRLYTENDVERLRKIVRLTNDLGVNLAGVEIILNLTEKLEALQVELDALQAQVSHVEPVSGRDNAP